MLYSVSSDKCSLDHFFIIVLIPNPRILVPFLLFSFLQPIDNNRVTSCVSIGNPLCDICVLVSVVSIVIFVFFEFIGFNEPNISLISSIGNACCIAASIGSFHESGSCNPSFIELKL